MRPRIPITDAGKMVLEVAVNVQADAIVTFNLRDYDKVPDMFNSAVINPAEALRSVTNG